MPSAPIRNLLLTWLIVLLCAVLSAEGVAQPDGITLKGYVCSTYPCPPPNKTPLFDDKIFDLSDKTPQTSWALSGKERYVWGEPAYSVEQRDQWKKSCSGARQEGMASFRECFERARQKAAEDNSRLQDEVSRKKNTPYRNAYPKSGKAKTKKKTFFTALPR